MFFILTQINKLHTMNYIATLRRFQVKLYRLFVISYNIGNFSTL